MLVVTFNGADLASAATGTARIAISAASRPLKKGLRRRKLVIPGRPGAWDFGSAVAEDYQIRISGHIVAGSSSDVMATAVALEALLDGKHDLVLSDQAGVIHTAQVFDEIRLSPSAGRARMVDFDITFECNA